jgi:DNA-binding transcriptional regulator YiaG
MSRNEQFHSFPRPLDKRTFTGMNLSEMLSMAQARDWATSGRARQIRISTGLTQQQVGDHCGVTGTAVAHWEAAERTPRGRPGLRWARLLTELAARPASGVSEQVAST